MWTWQASGTGWRPLRSVYQPFTIETLIYHPDMQNLRIRFLGNLRELICRQLSPVLGPNWWESQKLGANSVL
jgi:hypothetical protein